MRKGAFILFLYVFFISCQQKTKETQKTYEQLEAEVLCDVLPEIAMDFYEHYYFLELPPPPPELSANKFSKIEIDSITKRFDSISKNYYKKSQFQKDSLIKLIPKFKKVDFGVVS